MKKLFVLILMLASAGIINNVSAQDCTPLAPGGDPGLSPDWECLPCVVQGESYFAIIAIENFDSVGPVVISSLRLDSLTNYPSGLSYTTNPTNATFPGGGTGCIAVQGTSSDTVGNYKLSIYVTVTIAGIGTFNGEAGEIVADLIQAGIIDTTTTAVPNFDYYVRVITSSDTCARHDSCGFPISVRDLSNLFSNPVATPNPFNNKTEITWNSTADGMYTAKMFDVAGKEVLSQQLHVRIGTNNFTVEKGNLPSGSYVFSITDGRKSISTKLMIRE